MILEYIHYEEIAHKVYKYRAIQDFDTQTRVKMFDIDHLYFRLKPNGLLTIKKGYSCDACSGPTMDDDTNMHAGFGHDALYQLLRLGKLAISKRDFNRNRKLSDLTFKDQLEIDGMGKFRRNYYYYFVRWFGKKYAVPG